ncbi:MAG: cytochrome [Streptosporangiaceae bacterium]|nr:cytochrome [Streptosporangiaceae bacterium]
MAMRVLADAPEGSDLKPIPGDPGLPFLGQTLAMLRDPIGSAHRRQERYGLVSWGKILGRRMVAVLGPDAAEAVLVNRDKAFANGPAWSFFIGPFFYRGIMLLDFEEHLHHRRIMQQAFSRDRLRGYQRAMGPGIESGLDAWRPGPFKVLPHMKQLTLDLAVDVFMGVELDRAAADRINRAFVDAVRAGLAIVRFPVPGLRWSNGLKARKVLEEFFYRHLPAKRAEGGEDLFAALCQAETDDGHRFSDEDIVNHMIFVLMAAHDTSTITMATMAYYLAKNPEWQERVRAESLALGKEALDYEDLDTLVSMDLVMKESLRLVAPVPGLPRHTVKDTSILGFHVPAGTTVTLSPNVNHHLPEYWPDPDRFDPERFAEHRREDKVHQYAWEPFGGGVHKCIGLHFAGMQIKSVMHQLVRRYRWSVPADYEWPLDMSTLPVPKDGLPVTLEKI